MLSDRVICDQIIPNYSQLFLFQAQFCVTQDNTRQSLLNVEINNYWATNSMIDLVDDLDR